MALRISRGLTGWPRPPMTNAQKHAVIKSYSGRHPKTVFIESGTFRGDTVAAMRPYFDRLISIELFDDLHKAAAVRFADDAAVTIIKGDSGKVMPEILRELDSPAVFWLDGHFSGDGTALAEDTQCPIIAELAAIAARNHKSDIILIDDARLFGWRVGYPKITRMKDITAKDFPHHVLHIQEDILVISPHHAS